MSFVAFFEPSKSDPGTRNKHTPSVVWAPSCFQRVNKRVLAHRILRPLSRVFSLFHVSLKKLTKMKYIETYIRMNVLRISSNQNQDPMHSSPQRPEDSHAYFQCAIDAARHAGLEAKTGGCFGAVIVDNASGRVIASGYNQVLENNDPTAHAEIQAIRNACAQTHTFHLPDASLYTTSEPCPMCLAAAYWARISKIYYLCPTHIAEEYGQFSDTEFYEELAKLPQARSLPVIPMASVYPNEYTQMLNIWFKYATLKNRRPY